MSKLRFYIPDELMSEEMVDGATVERLVEFKVKKKPDGRKCLELVSVEGVPITSDLIEYDDSDTEDEESPDQMQPAAESMQSMADYINSQIPY